MQIGVVAGAVGVGTVPVGVRATSLARTRELGLVRVMRLASRVSVVARAGGVGTVFVGVGTSSLVRVGG